ncbi:MAG: ADOP family duplicated permease [Vicinamibacterales bacterium]
MRTVLQRLKWWWRRRSIADAFDQELAFHIDQQTAKNLQAGLTPDEARRQALLRFGGLESTRESVRDEVGIRWLDDALRDVRIGLRLLRRSPGYALASIMVLAVGIGASTAIFTIVDAVLLSPLPFPEPERLAVIRPTSGSRVSAEYFAEWRAQSRLLEDVAGWRDVRMVMSGAEEPLEVAVDLSTSNYFAVLATPPLRGRTFTASANLSSVEREVVLSHGFWQRHYGAREDVVGQAILLDGQPYTVVGIMPPGFVIRTNELAESRAELWVPLALTPETPGGMGGALNLVARLRTDATFDAAQEEVSLIAGRLEEQFPSYSRDWGADLVPLLDATVRDVRQTLLLMFGAVGILLLMACVNVANLALGRSLARQTELAVRVSLGATGGRLMRQLLTESVVLALAGGVLGFVCAVWSTSVLASAIPPGLQIPRLQEIGVDLRVLSFAALVTTCASVLFGVAPSMVATRSAAQSALRQNSRGNSGSRSQHRLAGSLVVTEMALALLLLAGAGLLARTFWELSNQDFGFDPARVLTMRTTLSPERYDTDDRIRAFSGEVIERVEALPGVEAAGFANYLPMSRTGFADDFRIQGRPVPEVGEEPFAWVAVVGGGYFDAMGIQLQRGRLPGRSEFRAADPVFVIDEQLARREWPGADPVGARLTWEEDGRDDVSGVVIGVVNGVRFGLAGEPPETVYWPLANRPSRDLTLVVRTAGDSVRMAGAIVNEIRQVDRAQPIADIRPMAAFVSSELDRPRFSMLVLAVFAAAALLMAATGLYGVMATSVAERTREIGIRVALGARRGDVFRLVFSRGVALVGAGLAMGLILAMLLGQSIAGLLYGVAPRDPATLLGVTVFLSAVALLAIYVPARRAVRVDPMESLRSD